MLVETHIQKEHFTVFSIEVYKRALKNYLLIDKQRMLSSVLREVLD